MFPRPRHHNPGWWSREGRARVQVVARALDRLLDAESRHREWRELGWQRSQQMSPSWRCEPRRFEGPPRDTPPEERLPPASGCRTPKGIPDGKRSGSSSTPSSVPGIGEAPCGPGEALLWPQSELPVGAKRSGKRGGFVGLNPEALCGEAPKGQPMIRSGSLEAVCVEAPEGQPMIHRRHPREPHNNGQTGEIEGETNPRKDP